MMRKRVPWAIGMVAVMGLMACSGGWSQLPPTNATPPANQAAVRTTGSGQPQGSSAAQVEYGVDWTSPQIPTEMKPGEERLVSVSLKNTGGQEWDASQIRISYHWYTANATRMIDQYDGLRSPLPRNVGPGQQVTVDNVRVGAPDQEGAYLLQLTLVQEFVTWFETQGANTLTVPVTIQA